MSIFLAYIHIDKVGNLTPAVGFYCTSMHVRALTHTHARTQTQTHTLTLPHQADRFQPSAKLVSGQAEVN